MLLARLSWPTKEPPNGPPLYWGERRVNESSLSESVGSVASTSRLTVVAAPVARELNTGSVPAVTVISSVTLATFKVRFKSLATPSARKTSLVVWGWNPLSETVTVYGPPMRMPGMSNLPSPREVASYFVPDGSCVATTLDPGTGCCCASLPTPVTPLVAPPCARAHCPAAHAQPRATAQ